MHAGGRSVCCCAVHGQCSVTIAPVLVQDYYSLVKDTWKWLHWRVQNIQRKMCLSEIPVEIQYSPVVRGGNKSYWSCQMTLLHSPGFALCSDKLLLAPASSDSFAAALKWLLWLRLVGCGASLSRLGMSNKFCCIELLWANVTWIDVGCIRFRSILPKKIIS